MLRILSMLFVFFPIFAFSQETNQSINGIVVNPKLEPIPNATVKIVTSDTDGVVKKFAFTNAEGKFVITVPTVTYPLYLQISFVGFETYNVLVTDSLINATKQFIITPLSKELPEVHVIADRSITKRGDTTSFKVAAFAKGNESNIADLLKKLPGFHIDETGSMTFNGKYISAVLVEDDDLFGRSYGNLINNASTNGLDKVEVIEHYKNTNKLESSLVGGDQTVVNLKYKKIGLRNFGEAQIGYAPKSNLISAKLSNTTLSKRVKGVTLGNKNQIGFLAQKLYGLSSENSASYNNNIQYPTRIDNITTPIGIYNIEPMNINSSRIFDNNSHLISSNLLIKPAKKILFKNNYAFLYDNFLQSYNNTTTYLNTVISTIVNEQSSIQKKNQYFFSEGELSINWNKHQQTRAYYFVRNNNNQHIGNGFFQNSPLQQRINNTTKQANAMLTNVMVLNETSYLNLNYAYQNSTSSSNYVFNNPLVDTIFKITSASKLLEQNLAYRQKTHYIGATWFKKLKYTQINITYSSTFKHVTPKNDASVVDNNNAASPLPNEFLVNQQIDYNENELALNVENEFSRKLKVVLSTKIKHVQYKHGVIDNRITNDKTVVLPSVNVGYNITTTQFILLNGSLNVEMPRLDQLNRASYFTSINAISSGTNTANIQRGYELGMYYRFYDPTGKKIILNISANYNKSPNIYNSNFSGRGLYAFYNLEPFYNNNVNNLYSQIEVEKNLVALKSWLKLKINPTYHQSFSNTNNVLTTNTGKSVQTELRFSTNWNKWFNLNTALAYGTSKQSSVVAGVFDNSFTSHDWMTNTTIELKLHEKWFLDIQHNYLLNKSFNQANRQIHFLDAKFKYNINAKIHSTLLFRNMLNTDGFSTNNASSTQNVVQNFALTPFIGLFSIGFKF